MKQKRNRFWAFKMNKCKHCKEENKENAKFCVSCGKELGTKKEHHGIKNNVPIIKTIGRILVYILFGFIALEATLFIILDFSFKGLLAFFLAIIGILIALPKFNQFTEKKFKKKLPTWWKMLALIIIFFITIVLLLSDGSDIQKEGELNLEDMDADEVLDTYFSLLDYNGASDRLSKIRTEKQLAMDSILQSLELEEDSLGKFSAMINDEIRMCNEEQRMMGEDICGVEFRKTLSVLEKSYFRNFEVLSKESIEKNPQLVKILVKYKTVQEYNFNKSEETGEITYILKKENEIWKISDTLDEKGKLFSESFDAKKEKEESEKILSKINESYNEFKNIFGQIEEVYTLKSTLHTKVKTALPDISLISFDLSYYNDQKGKYLLSVSYYYDDQFLVDDYVGFLNDASKMYKAIFLSDARIAQVQITAKQKYKDDYGNTQEKFLTRSLMDKETADRISWAGFESSSLDKITSVEFYGDSFYKELVDLRSDLNSWQTAPPIGSFGIGGFGVIPSSVCDDAKEQCNTYGECDLLTMMESQGMC